MLVVADGADPPLAPRTRTSRPSTRSSGSRRARAYTPRARRHRRGAVADRELGFTTSATASTGSTASSATVRWAYDPAPADAGLQGAGTVHHIAWACKDEDHLAWQAIVREAGRHVTEVLDRDYFRSIYFREPRHVLFEIATLSPGFASTKTPSTSASSSASRPSTSTSAARLEQLLTPLENPRAPASGEHAA
jgi:glyoxalase family protein